MGNLLHLIFKKDKAKDICKKYYRWLEEHKEKSLLII